MNYTRVSSDMAELLPVGAAIQTTVSTAATAIASAAQIAARSGARYALVQAQGADLRYTIDGATTPVGGATGLLLANGASVILRKEVLSAFSGIRNASTDVTAVVQFLG